MNQLSPVFKQKFENSVERILHVPGNYDPAKILEMTVVVDTSLEKELVTAVLPELLYSLKALDKVFQNVRFHLAYWKDEGVTDRVCPMLLAMSEGFYGDYAHVPAEKPLEDLVEYLRVLHARSKLILLLTNGAYRIENEEQVKQHMQPFLQKKMMEVRVQGTPETPQLSCHVSGANCRWQVV